MAEVLVLRALEAEDARWDAYVHAHAEGTFFHQLCWRRVIRRAYRSPDHYLFVERDHKIVGLLPLFERGAMPFARALVSAPVGVHGGVLADDSEVAALLKQGARAIAVREKLDYVEYKSERAIFDDLYTKKDLYFTFRQELFATREEQLQAVPRKARAVLRSSERAKLRADFNRNDLEAFYDLYAQSLRNLGTPMFPKELFIASLEEDSTTDILTVRQCGRIIGCVLNYYYKDMMMPFFAGALPEARGVGINNYMYWAMLEQGYDRGFRTFDFGRSKAGTGAFKFKKLFGMTPVPLHYQYDMVGADEPPNMNPTNPKFAKAIDSWKKLPVPLSNVLGPLLSRRIP